MFKSLIAFLLGFKGLATEIALLVEKQNEDGVWTGEEKMIVATKVFSEVVYVAEPWYLKLVPMKYQIQLIQWSITEVCEKIKKLKK